MKNTQLRELSNKEFIDLMKNDYENDLFWIEFVRRYQTKVIGYKVYQVFRQYDYSELSMVNEVVSRVYSILANKDCRALRQLENRYDGTIINYLRTISHREAVRFLKEESKQPTPASERDFPDIETDFEAIPEDLREAVEACLEEIMVKHKHKQRNKLIYTLHYFNGIPKKDIAESLNVNLHFSSICRIIDGLHKLIRNHCIDGQRIVAPSAM